MVCKNSNLKSILQILRLRHLFLSTNTINKKVNSMAGKKEMRKRREFVEEMTKRFLLHFCFFCDFAVILPII